MQVKSDSENFVLPLFICLCDDYTVLCMVCMLFLQRNLNFFGKFSPSYSGGCRCRLPPPTIWRLCAAERLDFRGSSHVRGKRREDYAQAPQKSSLLLDSSHHFGYADRYIRIRQRWSTTDLRHNRFALCLGVITAASVRALRRDGIVVRGVLRPFACLWIRGGGRFDFCARFVA